MLNLTGKLIVKISIFCFVLLLPDVGHAQQIPDSIPLFKQIQQDTSYVKSMRDRLSLRVYNIVKTTDFSIRNTDLNQRLRFSPNNGLGIGLGFSYKFLALDLGFVIPGTMRYRGDNPTTKFDLLSTLYGRKHVFDLTLQYYEGYFLRNADRVFPEQIDAPGTEMRPDITSVDVALSYLYVLNNKKFSFQAAFLGDMIQRRSAGSITFHGFASLYGLEAESALLRFDFENSLNEQARITQLAIVSTGTGIGYAHTFVLPKKFFVTLSGAPLLMVNTIYSQINDPLYDDIEDIRLNLRLFTRSAVGYNADRFYLIFNVIYDNFFVRFGDHTRFDYSPLKMKLFFGYRISKKKSDNLPLISN
jgi:hypothetical protein